MLNRLVLLLAVLIGLVGGQLQASGLCADASPRCTGCCTAMGATSCCHADDSSVPAPTPANPESTDWKLVLQPLVALLPKSLQLQRNDATVAPKIRVVFEGADRLDLICVRLI